MIARWRSRLRRDRGAASVFVVGMALVLFATAGLAIDGGKIINAKDKAFDVAEQAARAGANQIALAPLRDQGVVVLDQPAAADAASQFVTSTSYYQLSRPPTVTATTVTVAVRTTIRTDLLSIVGVDNLNINASATASPVTGINAGVAP